MTTKLNQLLAELCPEGVEIKKVWEVTKRDKKFNSVVAYKQREILSFKHISAKELKELVVDNWTIRLLSTWKFDGWTTKEKAWDNLNRWEIITIPSGGSANIKYYKGEFVDSGNILASSVDDKIMSLKYFYYFLLTKNEIIEGFFRWSWVKHPSMSEILELPIPIPPLPVQEEIVKILDKFTSLEAELEAELEARKCQYEFYRNQLLAFDKDEIVWKTLGKVVKIKRGVRVIKSDLSEIGRFSVFQNSLTPLWFYHQFNYTKDKTFIISAGAAWSVGYSKDDFRAADDCFVMECPDTINNKYLYYFLKNQENYLFSKVRRASIPRLWREFIEKIKIPLPPLEQQEAIVYILDHFDQLANDLTAGLPAELHLRQQQYAYYRDMLLNFSSELVSEREREN